MSTTYSFESKSVATKAPLDGAAFVTNQQHRIVSWNRGAEELLGRKASDVMGRSCHEVMRSRDVFGNRFCYRECPVMAMARAGEPVNTCGLSVPEEDGGDTPVDLAIQVIPGSRPGQFSLVHVVKALQAEAKRPVPPPPPPAPAELVEPPLTTREKEILRCVAAGLQNKEVAKELHISHATVRNHIRNILAKLEVHSKLEAVSLAFRSRWITAAEAPQAAEPESTLRVA